MRDKYVINDDEVKTFETRLKFSYDIFKHKYTKDEILKKSIQFKLNKTYDKYLKDLTESILRLQSKRDPIRVLKKANKK